MTSIETLVKSLEPGTAIFGRFGIRQSSKMETGFFIREEKYRIDAIPSPPNIYFKAVMFEKRGIVPVAVLIRIEGVSNPYDTWWDFQTKRIQECFDDMISQDHVLVHLYSDQEREKSFKVINSLKEPFERFKERIMEMNTWSTDQFFCIHREICKKYQSVEKMWNFFSKSDSKQVFSNN